MSATANTLRSYLLTELEARMIFDCLDAASNLDLTDEALVAVLELRERFRAEDDSDDCPACEGTGRLEVLPPSRYGPPACDVCDGTGKRKDPA